MSEVPPSTPPPAGAGGAPDSDARLWAMLSHLGAILFGLLAPLIIWLVKKDDSPFVEDQAKEALNFQITVFIALVICGVLSCVVIGFFLLPVVAIGNLVLCIMAGIKANSGEMYRYPFSIRLIK